MMLLPHDLKEVWRSWQCSGGSTMSNMANTLLLWFIGLWRLILKKKELTRKRLRSIQSNLRVFLDWSLKYLIQTMSSLKGFNAIHRRRFDSTLFLAALYVL